MQFWQRLQALFTPRGRSAHPEQDTASTSANTHTSAKGASVPEPQTLPHPPRIDWVNCINTAGTHRMIYYEWGAPDNPEVVFCVHGLTRTGRDFDALAAHLSRRYRVICPDVVGRGLSDWLPNKSEYAIPRYVSDLNTLIQKIRPQKLYWVGTSMGGLIAMAIAAQPTSPIAKLVLNDVGAVLSQASLQRIGAYVGAEPQFATFDDAVQYVRTVSAPFGPLSEAQWRHLTWHAVRQELGGRWVLRYDPGIAVPFRIAFPAQDMALWELYDAIRCPTLLVRGAESDLLTRDVAEAMTRRGPRARLVEIPGVGHAPALLDRAQIDEISAFLDQP